MLSTTDRSTCIDLARAIALDLHISDGSPLPATHLGVATLYSYLAQGEVLADGTDRAERAIDRGLTLVAERATSNRLIGGLSGIGWNLGNLVGESAEAVCTVIDDRLEQALAVPIWNGDNDLVRGLAGYGVYALTRLEGGAGARIAGAIVGHLERAAEHHERGIRWFTPPSLLPEPMLSRFPAGMYDLGLGHGLAGIAAVLARFVTAGIERERSARLVEGSIRYLLSTPHAAKSRFADVIVPGRVDPAGSRMAWCYGDLGIALALFAAARALDRRDWEAEALAVAHAMAQRPFEDTDVIDACICHGSAGVAHFFRRCHAAFPEHGFDAAADTWIRKTIELHRPGAGIGGYPMMSSRTDDRVEWEDNTSVLAGAPGTALVLLAAASDVPADWDEMLLFGS